MIIVSSVTDTATMYTVNIAAEPIRVRSHDAS